MIEILRRGKRQFDPFGRPVDGSHGGRLDALEAGNVVAVDSLTRVDELMPGCGLEDEDGRRWRISAVAAREPVSSDVGEAVVDRSLLLLAQGDPGTAILTLHLLEPRSADGSLETIAVTSPYGVSDALTEPAASRSFLRQAIAALPAVDQRDVEEHVWGGVDPIRTPFGRGYFSIFEFPTVEIVGSGFSFDPCRVVFEATFQRVWWQWRKQNLLLLLDGDGDVLFCGRQLS